MKYIPRRPIYTYTPAAILLAAALTGCSSSAGQSGQAAADASPSNALVIETVPETMITNARAKMPKYGLKNVGLIVQQGFGQEATDINELKSLLMQDLYKNSEEVLRAQSLQIDSLKRDLNKYHSHNHLTSELMPEMKVLFPYIKEVSCAHTYLMDMDSIQPDTVLLVYLKSKEKVREAEQEKIKKWLAARVEQKKIKLIIE